MVKLYYWNGRPNVGDYYSYWLAKKLFKNVQHNLTHPNLAIVGSILGHKSLSNDTVVWGSGWHNSVYAKKCNITNKDNFLAVRGKLTAEFLRLDETKVKFGDPGILASRFFTPKKLDHHNKLLILCHWQDYEDINKVYGKKYKVISMQTNDLYYVFNEIANSDFVLSSSLHGIIFAHSFGVPALHIIANEPESKGCFKFKDYYSAFNAPYKNYKLNYKNDLIKFSEFYANRNMYSLAKELVEKVQNDLLAVKPNEEQLSKTKTCLCAIAKNENNYIREWVEYHKNIGFNNIVLYDNNDINGEKFENVIKDYIDSGYVKIIDVRGKSNQQISCYDKFYHENTKKFDWIAFFDIDEFLHLDGNMSINEFVDQAKFEKFQVIAVNWKYFDDSGNIAIKNNNYSVTRFTHAFQEKDYNYAQHRFSKRIIRTNLKLTINSSHGPIHKAQMSEYNNKVVNDLKACNIAGEAITNNHLVFSEWSHDGGYLAHYRYKTLEEYINNKMKRGYPTVYKNSGKDMNIDEFFKYNEKTPEKINYLKENYPFLFESYEKPKDKKAIEAKSKLQEKTVTENKKPKINKKKKDKIGKDYIAGKENTFLYF